MVNRHRYGCDAGTSQRSTASGSTDNTSHGSRSASRDQYIAAASRGGSGAVASRAASAPVIRVIRSQSIGPIRPTVTNGCGEAVRGCAPGSRLSDSGIDRSQEPKPRG